MNGQKETRKREQQEDMIQIINFTAGGDEYAMDIRSVREVIDFHEITELPKAPRFIKGIINLRGEIIPVIDLRERFGLQWAGSNSLAHIIIGETAKKPLGVVVDGASHVVRLAQSEIASPPPLVGGLSGKYVSGVAKVKDRLIVILNMDLILTAEEAIELEKMDSALPPPEPDRTEGERW